MGDSENSNNDDNDNDDHNGRGSIFGKQYSASFKANKEEHQGSLRGIETIYKELQFPLPFSDAPTTADCDGAPSNTFPLSVVPKIFIKKQTKQPGLSCY